MLTVPCVIDPKKSKSCKKFSQFFQKNSVDCRAGCLSRSVCRHWLSLVLAETVLGSCLSCPQGHTSYPFRTFQSLSRSPKYPSIYLQACQLLHSPPNLGRAAAKRPIWRFCNLWIWRSGRVAPRCGAFVGYGLGPTTISKAAHDSRTPIAGSKSEIGTDQYSKRFAPFDPIDLLLWPFSHPNN